MKVQPIAIQRTGLVTSVGFTAPESCAAFRAKLTNPTETRFVDGRGEWVMAHQVELARPWRGLAKLSAMAAMAVREALDGIPQAEWSALPLLLCVAESDRPGRTHGLDDKLFEMIQEELDTRFAPQSAILTQGRVGTAVALARARSLVAQGGVARVLVVATDSLLSWPTLSRYESAGRLLTAENANGFMPGEGAGALLVGAARPGHAELLCTGIGFARESAILDSGEPLRGDGLTQAIKAGLGEAGREMHEMDFRITDISGEQYYFKEASLALSKTMRQRKAEFDIWHPAECTGEMGAASGLAVIVAAHAACAKGYAKGPHVLAHWANDGGQRAAATLHHGATR